MFQTEKTNVIYPYIQVFFTYYILVLWEIVVMEVNIYRFYSFVILYHEFNECKHECAVCYGMCYCSRHWCHFIAIKHQYQLKMDKCKSLSSLWIQRSFPRGSSKKCRYRPTHYLFKNIFYSIFFTSLQKSRIFKFFFSFPLIISIYSSLFLILTLS